MDCTLTEPTGQRDSPSFYLFLFFLEHILIGSLYFFLVMFYERMSMDGDLMTVYTSVSQLLFF